MTKKEALEPPPLRLMFEDILQNRQLFQDSKDWRKRTTSCHVSWLKLKP